MRRHKEIEEQEPDEDGRSSGSDSSGTWATQSHIARRNKKKMKELGLFQSRTGSQGPNAFGSRIRKNMEKRTKSDISDAPSESATDSRRTRVISDHLTSQPKGEDVWRETFFKMQDDGQIHHDDLSRALELSGFSRPESSWIDEVYYTITQYSAMSLDDFIQFVRGYEKRQKKAFADAFTDADTDGSGEVEMEELAEVLKNFGIEPMRHVLNEVFEETDEDGKGTLDLEEFDNVMDLIRVREGFTKKEYEEFMYVYHKFDFDGSGEIDTQELTGVLGWLGYVCDLEVSRDILKEVDIDGSGTLNPREYLMCMRKVREREVGKIQRYMLDSDADKSGTISQQEIAEIVHLLGYSPDESALEEAADEAGIEDKDNMDLSDVWQLLSRFRAREGFSRVEANELAQAFEKFDVENNGEISTVQISKLLRWMGYAMPFELAQNAVAKVDVNASGLIDLPELRKMIRLQYERERKMISQAFRQQDVWGTGMLPEIQCVMAISEASPVIEALGFVPEMMRGMIHEEMKKVKELEGKSEMSLHRLLAMLKEAKKQVRAHFREHYGFSPRETLELKAIFRQYDSGNGQIGNKELIRLVEDVFPTMAHSKEMRPKLLQIVKKVDVNGDGNLSFSEFLKLMQMLRELQNEEKFSKQKECMEKSGFAPSEVESFRELFLGTEHEHMKHSKGMTFEDMKTLINNIVPLGDKMCGELASHFQDIEKSRRNSDAIGSQDGILDFPDFLMLMKKLTDINFGKLHDRVDARQPTSSERQSEDLGASTETMSRKMPANARIVTVAAGIKSTNKKLSRQDTSVRVLG
jgi:Ca2+-binding EF-hand superfamily protein